MRLYATLINRDHAAAFSRVKIGVFSCIAPTLLAAANKFLNSAAE